MAGFRHLVAAIALLMAPGVSFAAPAADRVLSISNHSRQAILELYVSGASDGDWGAERLGDDTIPPNRSATVRLGHGRDCSFDIRVVFADGSVEERHGFDACRGRQVVFDGSTAERITDHDVAVTNASARPLREIYISSEQTNGWGDDLLGDTSVPPARTAHVHYRGGCHGDMRVVFDNDGAEERYGMDFCLHAGVTIAPGWAAAD